MLQNNYWETPEGRMKIARHRRGLEKITGVQYDEGGAQAELVALRAQEAGYGNGQGDIQGESAASEWGRIAEEEALKSREST